MDLGRVLESFPRVTWAIAYGSGVFHQVGYAHQERPGATATSAPLQSSASAQTQPMVDFIFAVDDARAWHAENMALHSEHYSAVRYLGSRVIAALQQDMGAGLYYNTLVPMPGVPGVMMKYGVITTHALVDDLLHWRSLYVSGRMHKPVRVLASTNADVDAASVVNLRQATIAGLSYGGDFRMIVGENKNKVSNIVMGSLQNFRSLYEPILQSFAPMLQPLACTADGYMDVIRQDTSLRSRLQRGVHLPRTLQVTLEQQYFRSIGKWPHLSRADQLNDRTALATVLRGPAAAARLSASAAAVSASNPQSKRQPSNDADVDRLPTFLSARANSRVARSAVSFWAAMASRPAPLLGRAATTLPPLLQHDWHERHLRPALAQIVSKHATRQSLKGLVTAGPLKSMQYTSQKLRKYFKSLVHK